MVISELIEAFPEALRLMDDNSNLPIHLAVAKPNRESKQQTEILHSNYPQGFLQKNHKGQRPIDCCGKDDMLFAHLAHLCPESLLIVDAPEKRGPLAPLTAHLLRHYKFPSCRARFLQRVFDTVLPHIKSRESQNHGQEIKELKQQIHHLQTKVETIQNQCNRQNVEKQKLDQLQELRNKKDQQQQQQHIMTKTPVHYVDCLSSISLPDQEQFEEFTANGPSKRARVSIDGL